MEPETNTDLETRRERGGRMSQTMSKAGSDRHRGREIMTPSGLCSVRAPSSFQYGEIFGC